MRPATWHCDFCDYDLGVPTTQMLSDLQCPNCLAQNILFRRDPLGWFSIHYWPGDLFPAMYGSLTSGGTIEYRTAGVVDPSGTAARLHHKQRTAGYSAGTRWPYTSVIIDLKVDLADQTHWCCNLCGLDLGVPMTQVIENHRCPRCGVRNTLLYLSFGNGQMVEFRSNARPSIWAMLRFPPMLPYLRHTITRLDIQYTGYRRADANPGVESLLQPNEHVVRRIKRDATEFPLKVVTPIVLYRLLVRHYWLVVLLLVSLLVATSARVLRNLAMGDWLSSPQSELFQTGAYALSIVAKLALCLLIAVLVHEVFIVCRQYPLKLWAQETHLLTEQRVIYTHCGELQEFPLTAISGMDCYSTMRWHRAGDIYIDTGSALVILTSIREAKRVYDELRDYWQRLAEIGVETKAKAYLTRAAHESRERLIAIGRPNLLWLIDLLSLLAAALLLVGLGGAAIALVLERTRPARLADIGAVMPQLADLFVFLPVLGLLWAVGMWWNAQFRISERFIELRVPIIPWLVSNTKWWSLFEIEKATVEEPTRWWARRFGGGDLRLHSRDGSVTHFPGLLRPILLRDLINTARIERWYLDLVYILDRIALSVQESIRREGVAALLATLKQLTPDEDSFHSWSAHRGNYFPDSPDPETRAAGYQKTRHFKHAADPIPALELSPFELCGLANKLAKLQLTDEVRDLLGLTAANWSGLVSLADSWIKASDERDGDNEEAFRHHLQELAMRICFALGKEQCAPARRRFGYLTRWYPFSLKSERVKDGDEPLLIVLRRGELREVDSSIVRMILQPTRTGLLLMLTPEADDPAWQEDQAKQLEWLREQSDYSVRLLTFQALLNMLALNSESEPLLDYGEQATDEQATEKKGRTTVPVAEPSPSPAADVQQLETPVSPGRTEDSDTSPQHRGASEATHARYHSCFISYSSQDEAFAGKLYDDLKGHGVACWYAPKNIRIGDPIRQRIDDEIQVRAKLLLVLSQHSVASDWVESEVEAAFEKERQTKELVLFPIRLDEAVMETKKAWAADLRRKRHIGDFRTWREPAKYQQVLELLLRDLQVEG